MPRSNPTPCPTPKTKKACHGRRCGRPSI